MKMQSELISVEPQHEFTINLGSRPSTGYVWTVEAYPEELSLLDSQVGLPAEQFGIGGLVRQDFHFRSSVPGEYTIQFALKRPWEKKVMRNYEVQVKVA
jgi:predicted secreted protein